MNENSGAKRKQKMTNKLPGQDTSMASASNSSTVTRRE